MVKRLSRLWSVIVRVEETQGVLLWLLSPLGGVAAMISAYIEGLPLYQILFWGTGVSAFSLHALFHAWQWRQRTTVFEKLRLDKVSLAAVAIHPDDTQKLDLTMQFTFHNAADIPMYFYLTCAVLSIDGTMNPKARIDPAIFLIEPHSDHFVTTATVPRLHKQESFLGSVDFSVRYGHARDNLKYVMDHEGELRISIVDDPNNPRAAHVTCGLRHKSISHTIRAE